MRAEGPKESQSTIFLIEPSLRLKSNKKCQNKHYGKAIICFAVLHSTLNEAFCVYIVYYTHCILYTLYQCRKASGMFAVCRTCAPQFSRLGIKVSLATCLSVWVMVGWVPSPFFSF